ncbi:type II toxin-antitoxin system RelE/ParE family toxin [Mucilaginibacter sp.]|uniref:type II toxin-antitoxin system RelE/ParE family toxin n=1 Tax=Mucilaginibacter sp. TaxID=1882438 RepID=UPI002624CEB7|nr:type II toxin-antitoxin system RelE/ParE family toxin [Mucilaginibacter sp.]MDB5031009.1 Toxin-antitoxin system, toxin component, RelE family [Mucilaginibacter sp.]
MSYNIEITALFEKQLKRLAKKFPSLKKEYIQLIASLKENPKYGTAIGNNCYKIRLAIASKGKGKSGGARVITHAQITKTKIYLLSIYDKSEQSDIADSDLIEWVKIID